MVPTVGEDEGRLTAEQTFLPARSKAELRKDRRSAIKTCSVMTYHFLGAECMECYFKKAHRLVQAPNVGEPIARFCDAVTHASLESHSERFRTRANCDRAAVCTFSGRLGNRSTSCKSLTAASSFFMEE